MCVTGGRRCPSSLNPSKARQDVLNQRRRANDAVKAALIENAIANGSSEDSIAELRSMSPGEAKSLDHNLSAEVLTSHVDRDVAAFHLAERYRHEAEQEGVGDADLLLGARDVIDAIIATDGDVRLAAQQFEPANRDEERELISSLATAAALVGIEAKDGEHRLNAQPIQSDPSDGAVRNAAVRGLVNDFYGRADTDGASKEEVRTFAGEVVDSLVESKGDIEAALAILEGQDPEAYTSEDRDEVRAVLITAARKLGVRPPAVAVVNDVSISPAEARNAKRRQAYARNKDELNAKRRAARAAAKVADQARVEKYQSPDRGRAVNEGRAAQEGRAVTASQGASSRELYDRDDVYAERMMAAEQAKEYERMHGFDERAERDSKVASVSTDEDYDPELNEEAMARDMGM